MVLAANRRWFIVFGALPIAIPQQITWLRCPTEMRRGVAGQSTPRWGGP